MKIRVVGGPIRRDDRLVVEVTSNTTFESILSVVHQKVEELDLLDLAREHFTHSKSPTVVVAEPTMQPHLTEFGDQVLEEGGGDSSASEGEEDPPTQNAKKKSQPVVNDRPLVASLGQPGVAAAATDPAESCVRLTLHPVDAAHYDVALLEFDASGKPKATKTCRPGDTPRTVQMRVPVIGLFLKKALRSTSPENATPVPNMSLVSPQGIEDLMAFANRSHATPNQNAPISGASPLVEMSSVSPQQLMRKESCREGSTHHEDLAGMSRPQSFSMARYSHTSPGQRPLDRLLLLYRIAKTDVGRVTAMERLVARVGRRAEAFLDIAEAAMIVDRPDGGGGFIDAPLGVSFRLQHTKDFLTTSICALDGKGASRDAASILADMVVHVAPAGSETLYAAAFIGAYMSDAHIRNRPIVAMVRSAQQRLPMELGVTPASLERLEVAHREIIGRLAMRAVFTISLFAQCAALATPPRRHRMPQLLTTPYAEERLDMSFDDTILTPFDHIASTLSILLSDTGCRLTATSRGDRVSAMSPSCLDENCAARADGGTSDSNSVPPTPNLQETARRPTLQPSSYPTQRHVDPCTAASAAEQSSNAVPQLITRVAVLEEEVRCMRLTLEQQTATMAKFLAQRV